MSSGNGYGTNYYVALANTGNSIGLAAYSVGCSFKMLNAASYALYTLFCNAICLKLSYEAIGLIPNLNKNVLIQTSSYTSNF